MPECIPLVLNSLELPLPASSLSLLSLSWAFIWICFYSWEAVIARPGEGVILKNKVLGFHPALLVCVVAALGTDTA